MANEIDPHHLVLIIHAKYGSRRQDGAPRRLDTTNHILEHGIGHDRNTNLETFRILDAFSSLSVHNPKGQVMAFALQWISDKKEIRFTIAENKNVRVGLDTYVQKIWEGLRKLSKLYASCKPEGSDQARRLPVGLPLEAEIYRTISQHTLPKQLKRVKALTEPLTKFVAEVLEYRGDTYPQDFDKNLCALAKGAAKIAYFLHDLYNGKGQTDEEWESIFLTSIAVSSEAAIVLTAGDHFGCERLAEEVNLSKDHPAEHPFRLRRTIDKLISQSGHIKNLFEFADSPSLQSFLKSDLIISLVPKETCPARLPKSWKAWESILIAEDLGDPSNRQEVAKALAKFNTLRCPIHCESKLIQHFATGDNDIPPFNYIGVSKLSCGACRVWLEAFNELGEQPFYTRGSHGAWYWPWGMPMENVSLREAVVKKLRLAYIEHQNLDSQTESTIASVTHETLPHLTTNKREGIFSKWIKQKKEAYREYNLGLVNDVARFFRQGLQYFPH